MNWYIVYEVRITETKIANQELLNRGQKNQHFLFPKAIANVYKTTRFTALFLLVRSDPQQQLNANKLLCSRTIIIVTVYQ